MSTTEQTVIGILVSAGLAQEQLDEHLCWLDESYFVEEGARQAVRAVVRLRNAGEWVDAYIVTVDSEANEKVIDPAYVWNAEQDAAPLASLPTYLRRLESAREKRITRDALTTALHDLDNGEAPSDVMRAAQEATEETRTDRLWSQDEMTAPEALERLREPGSIGTYRTGLHDLDSYIGNLRPGCVYLLVGDTGDGKTTTAVQFAANVIEQGARVDFYSTEMSGPDLMLRFLANSARIDSRKLEPWACGESDLPSVATAAAAGDAWADWLERDKLSLVYRAGLKASDIVSRSAEHARRRGKPDLVIVDYIQRLAPEKGEAGQPRNVQVGTMSSILKDAAMVLQCPILVLVQPNRAWLNARIMTPDLEHLGESSRLEKDADVVISIGYAYRRNKDADAMRGKLAVRVIKQRRGPLGWLWAAYVPSCSRVTTLGRAEWPVREEQT